MFEIKEELKGCIFKGFEGIEVWRILYLPSENERILNIKSDYFRIFYHILLKKTKYKLISTGSDLLYFLFYKGRKDFQQINENMLSLVESKDVLDVVDLKHVNQINLSFIISIVRKIPQWIITLNKTRLSKKQKLIALDYLILNYKCAFDIKKIKFKHYKFAIIFNDADTVGNYVSQYLQSLNIQTASMQHGVILAPRKDIKNIDFAGIELNNFVSDHLMAWNNFTKEQAIKTGIPKEKIDVLGIVRCMDVYKLPLQPFKKIFGVVLDGRYTAKTNISLIECANYISEKLNMKYILKYHPSDNPHLYDNIVNKKFYIGFYDKNKSIKEYALDVDFSIIANSTVYMELVFLFHRTYRLSSIDLFFDKYSNIKTMSFSNKEELMNLIQLNKDDVSEMNNLFNILCTVENVRDSYKNYILSKLN